MGTDMHHKSYLPGYYSMRDTNEDSNSSSWPLVYGDKALTNGHYYNGLVPRTITDSYTGYDKDALKNKMLEHEAIFKSQVYELHRLYGRQRDMMEEVKRKELLKHRVSIDTSSSSSLLPSEDARKWQMSNSPFANNSSGRPSLFGAEIMDSPLSCTKGSTSKDCEVLDCRPLKVRKKLFDLQLPADGYIDDTEKGEQVQENKSPDNSGYPSIGKNGSIPKNGVKLFHSSNGFKSNLFGDASSDQCMRGSSGLADLNEPIQEKEANVPNASVDFLGFSHEHFLKSQNGKNLSVEHKNNGRDWLSCGREGNSRSGMSFTSQFRQPEKFATPSVSMQHTRVKDQETSGHFPIENGKVELWRERVGGTSEVLDHSHYNRTVPTVPSFMSGSYPFVNSYDMANTWSERIASWGNPSGSLAQNLTSVQPHPSFISSGTMSRSSLTFQSDDTFGDKNSSSRSKMDRASDLPTSNEFNYGFSSGSKGPSTHVPSLFDSLNCNRGDNVRPEHSYNHGLQNLFKGSDFTDSRSMKDMDLNLNADQDLSNEEVPQKGLGVTDDKKKCEDQEALPPWLRGKSVSKKDTFKQPLVQGETQNFSSVSSVNVVEAKERSDFSGSRKLLGFPIFGNQSISKTDSSSFMSSSASLRCHSDCENIEKEMKHGEIDINVALDSTFETGKQIDAEVFVDKKEVDTKINNFRSMFDLNSCLTEEEDLLTQSVKSTSAEVNRVEIDLEAPFIPDIENSIMSGEVDQNKLPETLSPSPQHNQENPEVEELVKLAAEAIVSISISDQKSKVGPASEEVSMDDPLMWFVEVVSSCADNFDEKSRNSFSGEMDDFEVMTLQLEETKEDEYMPVPFVSETHEPEEMGPNHLRGRPRRGQARRGRPKRNFQRDILPGLTSLSRPEVTEDLQIFGGLMRATGHVWSSGLTRKNGTRGGARGRRRTIVADPPPPPVVEQNNKIEVALEDRSLTAGWAKTPRRPRRQRCPPTGNSVAVTLT